MTQSKKQGSGGARRRAGRKPLSAYGLERRDAKVLASFTAQQFEALEADADEEGMTVSELVAQRALAIAR